MEWVRDGPSKRQFEAFAAETANGLFRTGFLMNGDAEDAVQKTYIGVARRWRRVRSMDPPADYARRISDHHAWMGVFAAAVELCEPRGARLSPVWRLLGAARAGRDGPCRCWLPRRGAACA